MFPRQIRSNPLIVVLGDGSDELLALAQMVGKELGQINPADVESDTGDVWARRLDSYIDQLRRKDPPDECLRNLNDLYLILQIWKDVRRQFRRVDVVYSGPKMMR